MLVDRLKVGHAWIAAVRQQQAIRQGRRLREELAFRLGIGSNLHGPDLVGKPAVRGVDIHRRGFERREPTGKGPAQHLLSANDEPSWITMSLKRATAAPPGVRVCTLNRSTSRATSRA
jgi:hypothetical protein